MVYGFKDSKSKVEVVDKATYDTKMTEIEGELPASGTGITVADGGVINHSNSITASTGYVGSATKVPMIKYDAQGHIIGTSSATIYPPTTVGTSGQYWVSDGAGAGKWQTADTEVTEGSTNLVTSDAVFQAIQAGSGGYNSNQIIPLGYFTGTATFTKNAATGNTGSGYKYYLSKTYNSTTTTKNSSNGLIQITSSDSISVSVNAGDSMYGSNSFTRYSSTSANVTYDISSIGLPNGTYKITYKTYITDVSSRDGCTLNTGGYGTPSSSKYYLGSNTSTVDITDGTITLTYTNVIEKISPSSSTQLYWVENYSSHTTGILDVEFSICFTEILQQS